MAETIRLELTRSEAEQLSAMIEEVLVAMRRADELMAQDQREIDRLKLETRETINRDWRGGVNVEAILRPDSSDSIFDRSFSGKHI
jgi:hypothetical protein